MTLSPPERSVPPGPGDPTVVRTVDPDGLTEQIAIWWDGTSLADVAWIEVIFGARHFRFTGERKVERKARPVALGRIEFSAPVYEPDPATLEINGQRVADLVPEGDPGVWLVGRRPYQPKVRLSAEQVLGGVDPGLVRLRDAVIEGKAESSMTIEKKTEQ